jgi:Flp pilus assembly protein TadB
LLAGGGYRDSDTSIFWLRHSNIDLFFTVTLVAALVLVVLTILTVFNFFLVFTLVVARVITDRVVRRALVVNNILVFDGFLVLLLFLSE